MYDEKVHLFFNKNFLEGLLDDSVADSKVKFCKFNLDHNQLLQKLVEKLYFSKTENSLKKTT